MRHAVAKAVRNPVIRYWEDFMAKNKKDKEPRCDPAASGRSSSAAIRLAG